MTISLNIGLNLTNATGAVTVTPDRLLTFSETKTQALFGAGPIAQGSAAGQILPSNGAAALLATVQGAPQTRRYTFRINPSKLSVSHEKLERYILTKFGYERQSWGNGLTMFQYSGTSGVFRQEAPGLAVGGLGFLGFGDPKFDIRTSYAWQKFREFEEFYRRTGGTNIFMYFVDYPHEWEGSLSDFRFERSATSPFHIDYSFKFTALPIDYAPASSTPTAPSSAAPANQALAASATPFLGSGTAITGR